IFAAGESVPLGPGELRKAGSAGSKRTLHNTAYTSLPYQSIPCCGFRTLSNLAPGMNGRIVTDRHHPAVVCLRQCLAGGDLLSLPGRLLHVELLAHLLAQCSLTARSWAALVLAHSYLPKGREYERAAQRESIVTEQARRSV